MAKLERKSDRVKMVQPRAVERRESIMQAARVVIKANGRDEFTTAQVAEEAGCAIGTVYSYFENRTAILDAVWPLRPQEVPW